MKFILIILLLCSGISKLAGQEKHFVFIQSDNSQLFYVSVKGKIYSSTAAGYVIIPKLAAGDYDFSIGFVKNTFPEQSFQFTIEKKDLGFNLKNFGEKGWGLFDLQSLNVSMAKSSAPPEEHKAISENTAPKSDFEPLISFEKKQKDKPAETKAAAETLTTQPETATKKPPLEEEKPAASVAAESSNISATTAVKKVLETSEADGVHLAYTETSGDTIFVIISAVKSEINEDNTLSSDKSVAGSKAISSAKPVAGNANSSGKDDLKFLEFNEKSARKGAFPPASPQQENAAAANSNCKDVATDEDYSRLRRKMAQQDSDEKMIAEAKKLYRNKCFTTTQIKKLSTLFLSDEGRYNFFNASYDAAADASQYATLQSEFIDPAFVNRFKALLR